jgi:hypothetical protein
LKNGHVWMVLLFQCILLAVGTVRPGSPVEWSLGYMSDEKRIKHRASLSIKEKQFVNANRLLGLHGLVGDNTYQNRGCAVYVKRPGNRGVPCKNPIQEGG